MARKRHSRGGNGTTKWLWYGAAAVVGYIVLDKLGIIDQVRSRIGGAGGTSAAADVARINYAYSSNERDRQWLNMQYPEQMAYIGNAYGQGSQSMSGDYNSIPFALS